jgi:hypothetical protein
VSNGCTRMHVVSRRADSMVVRSHPRTPVLCATSPTDRFTVKATGERLCFINTHFDHESDEARDKAAAMLVQMLPTVSLGLPTAVTGARAGCGCGQWGSVWLGFVFKSVAGTTHTHPT